jgi:RNA polymerase sigma-70 factor (ECF subfamily)
VLPFASIRPMGPLTAAFLGVRRRRDAGAGGERDGDRKTAPAPVSGSHAAFSLEGALAALVERGAAAHPDLSLDGAQFAAHLGRCGASVETAASQSIHAEDLFLVAAALAGDGAAVARLRQLHRPVLAGYLRHIDVSTAFIDEVEQRLWDMALVGKAGAEPNGAEPKLVSYSGQGALAGWVGIAAQRIALMIHRHEAAEERAVDGATAEAEAEAEVMGRHPELAFIKGRLREKFRPAITQALSALEDRERMIFRLHLVDGLTVEVIAKMYSVSHSTVSRWLAKARDEVIRETQRLLRDEMRLSPAEFESVAALVVSQLDLSVSRILRGTG